MKWSKYNYLYYSQKYNTHLLYNSLSNSFIKLDNKEVLSSINMIKENINNFDFSSNHKFYNQLIRAKIITESDEIEISYIKHQILKNRYSPFTLVITILPTLDCNFKCPYCFEKEENKLFMTEEIENRIFQFIQNNIRNISEGLYSKKTGLQKIKIE